MHDFLPSRTKKETQQSCCVTLIPGKSWIDLKPRRRTQLWRPGLSAASLHAPAESCELVSRLRGVSDSSIGASRHHMQSQVLDVIIQAVERLLVLAERTLVPV